MVQWFLETYPDMRILPVERREGFCEGRPDRIRQGVPELKKCVRIFPHRGVGEGHFAVLLEKRAHRKNRADRTTAEKERAGDGVAAETQSFLEKTGILPGRILYQGAKVFAWTDEVEKFHETGRFQRLRVIYEGLLIGEERKGRFEPSTQLALALRTSEYPDRVDLAGGDIRLVKYLKGETIAADCQTKGHVLVCADGFPVGWCKANGQGNLKNKYYPGWRMV